MTDLAFDGQFSLPAASSCGAGCGPDASFALAFSLAFELSVSEFFSGSFELDGSAVTTWAPLVAATLLEDVRVLALTREEGSLGALELLFGTPPELDGTTGVFPLAGNETLAFQLVNYAAQGGTVRFTVSAVLTLGMTAVQAAAAVNAAALLAGLTRLVASVSGGQLQLVGDVPGALEGLVVTTPAPGAGFAGSGLVLGTGSPLSVDAFLTAFKDDAGVLGSDVWVRGGPCVARYFVAGS